MSEAEFYAAGCEMMKHGQNNSAIIGNRRYRGLFGTSPTICSIIWRILTERNAHPIGGRPVHLLYALLFLKTYATAEIFRSITDKDEKTFRKWAWDYIDTLAWRLDVVRSGVNYCSC
jgi:hypothetical protein